MVHFGEFLKTWSLRSNSVTRQVSFNRTKIVGKCQSSKIQMRHFGWFSNTVENWKTTEFLQLCRPWTLLSSSRLKSESIKLIWCTNKVEKDSGQRSSLAAVPRRLPSSTHCGSIYYSMNFLCLSVCLAPKTLLWQRKSKKPRAKQQRRKTKEPNYWVQQP